MRAAGTERETLELAAAGAATVLGPRHSATRAFARAAATMDRVDLWHARLALKCLTRDRRQAIAEAVEHSAEPLDNLSAVLLHCIPWPMHRKTFTSEWPK